jgi:hypothetical protein
MTQPIHEPTPERTAPPELSMAYLAERLDFAEDDEMAAAHRALVEAMASGSEHVRDIAEDYQMRAEAVVDAADNSDARNTRRVGANIAMALIRIEAGRVADGVEDLYDVLDDIDGLIVGGYDDLAAVAEIIEEKIRKLTSNEAELQ